MTTRHPWMKVYARDLLGDQAAGGWEIEEFGAYVKLLCIAWERGGIPTDPTARARLLGISPRREQAIWSAIGVPWRPSGEGLLVLPEQEEQRAEARARSESGKRAAEARWGPRGSNANAVRPHTEAICAGDASTSTTTTEPRESPSRSSRASASEENSLAHRVCSILTGGVEGLSDNDHGRPWPTPRLAAIRDVLAEHEADSETAERVARGVREVVQSDDRAPNIVALYDKKLEEAV